MGGENGWPGEGQVNETPSATKSATGDSRGWRTTPMIRPNGQFGYSAGSGGQRDRPNARNGENGDMRLFNIRVATGMFLWKYRNVRGDCRNVPWNYRNAVVTTVLFLGATLVFMGGTAMFAAGTVMFTRAAMMSVAATVMFVAADANPAFLGARRLCTRENAVFVRETEVSAGKPQIFAPE